MGRLLWSCSYKRTTIIISCINILAALYVVNSLYSSVNTFSNFPANYPDGDVEYTADQIKKMEDAIRVRKEAEPLQLVKLVNKIKEELSREERSVKLPQPLRVKLADEILHIFKGLARNATLADQREALENWRKIKLKETKELKLQTETSNSTIPDKESSIVIFLMNEMLRVALESDWEELLEYIGVWMPPEIDNKESDYMPGGDEDLDDQIIPGRLLSPQCNAERHTDYGGAAVKWGLTYHKESAADCCQACLDQAKVANPGQMKCNIWVYCPSENGCHSPDIYEHKHQECWLKQVGVKGCGYFEWKDNKMINEKKDFEKDNKMAELRSYLEVKQAVTNEVCESILEKMKKLTFG